MNHSPAFRRMLAPVLALALVCTLSLPASAFFWNKKTDVPSVSDFSKNGMVGQVISFLPRTSRSPAAAVGPRWPPLR